MGGGQKEQQAMNDYRDRGHFDGPCNPHPPLHTPHLPAETAALALALAPASWASDLARVSVGEVSLAGRVWSVSCRA